MTSTPALVPDEVIPGHEFRRLREQAGLTQKQAAICCGVDQSTVYRWETGKQKHTHKSKDSVLEAGLDIMRWAVAKHQERGQPVTTAEMVLEQARRDKQQKRKVA